MRVGFNYPWPLNLYGATFGPNPHCPLKQWQEERKLVEQGQIAKVPPAAMFGALRRNLDNLSKMKITMVRIFVVANGFNYLGTGPIQRKQPPPPPGLPASPYYDWEFSPPLKADPLFAYHFGQMLKVFKDAGMQVIPSFVDFGLVGNSRMRDAKGLAPGGRADLIKDASKRQVFLATMLNDLLVASKGYKDQIYAWEVINEPLWCYTAIGALSDQGPEAYKRNPDSAEALAALVRNPEVTVDEMNTFIGEVIELISSRGFESTVGHRLFRDLMERKDQEWQGIKPPDSFLYYAGSKPQFHYYAKPTMGLGDPYQIKDGGLFDRSKLNVGIKPFLGEFASDLNHHGKPWPELKGKDTTLNRLKTIEAEGCELALIWPDRGGDPDKAYKSDPLKLEAVTRQALVQFTGGTLPPADE